MKPFRICSWCPRRREPKPEYVDRMQQCGHVPPSEHSPQQFGQLPPRGHLPRLRGHLPPSGHSPQQCGQLPPSGHLPRAESQETKLQEHILADVARVESTLQTFQRNFDRHQKRIYELITFCLTISCEQEWASRERDYDDENRLKPSAGSPAGGELREGYGRTTKKTPGKTRVDP